MSNSIPARPNVSDFLRWFEANADTRFTDPRLVKTAVKSLVAELAPEMHLMAVGELLETLPRLGALMIERDSGAKDGLSPSTIQTYVSRVRGAILAFLRPSPDAPNIVHQPPAPGGATAYLQGILRAQTVGTWGMPGAGSRVTVERAPSVDVEIDEALASMARWPTLRRFLLPHLLEAIEFLQNRKKEEP